MSFRIAEKQAKKSPFNRHKLGAVIVKGNRVLSTGYNEIRFSKYTGTNTVHAEESAIIKLLKARRLHDLVGSTLYVTRFTPGGAIALSKPCERCIRLIRSVGISTVLHTTDEGVEKICMD